MATNTSLAPHISARPTLPSPLGGSARIAAVLFDLDGTLYRQRPVRIRMAMELALSTLTAPVSAAARWRALQAFREAQETMRRASEPASMASQIAAAAARTGISEDRVRVLVDEWMFERPSRFLSRYLAEGTTELLALLASKKVPIGLFSDYPSERKLSGLGLRGRFSPVICATDAEVGAFKPDPRGFLRACELWGLAPSDVLYVGDRVEVDGIGAAAAGMPCVIVGPPHSSGTLPAGTIVLPSFERLSRVFAG